MGRQRDGRQSFYRQVAGILKPLDPKAETVAKVVDYSDTEFAPCVIGVFENRLGGRICVARYYPWTFLHNLSKSNQMKSIMRWLSKDQLPGYIASYHKIDLWIRQPQKGRVTLAMTNSSFDTAEEVVLLLLTDNRLSARLVPAERDRTGGSKTGAVSIEELECYVYVRKPKCP
ncbi:MAG: hypothetical protein ABGX16_20045 [Pirellulales bacterium]